MKNTQYLNRIYCGDCLFVMEHDVFDRGIKADLIYLDPPFFTGEVQRGTWKPEAMEISFDDSKEFWGGKKPVWERAPEWMKWIAAEQKRPEFASYLFYMRERLKWCRNVLSDSGSIYLHCDTRASHYLKMIMDEIFGVNFFVNEVVWGYRTGGVSKKWFPSKHDTIFLYVKSDKYVFHPITERIFYEKPFFSPKIDENGRYCADVYVRDVWDNDLKPVINVSKERMGYPTQKPESLLERIIKASSNEGDVVLDPFCGCGTAIVSAHRLGRKWVGIDVNPDGCMIMQKRFEQNFGFTPEIVLRNEEQVKKLNEREFEDWVNEFYGAEKPSPDRGIDGVTQNGIPIQTKAGSGEQGYAAISQFFTDMKLHPKVPQPIKKGIFVSRDGFDNEARASVDQIFRRENIKIELVSLKDLFRKPEEKLEVKEWDRVFQT